MKKNERLSLPGIQLASRPDDNNEAEIEVIREGVYSHPYYGKMVIDRAFLNSMVLNFEKNVLRKEIALDYGHQWDKEAAAWFKSLRLEEQGGKTSLFAKVKFTKAGKQKVEDEEYKYISADFNDDYADNETDIRYGPTLFGAGLTNSPFIKGMSSVQLGEFKEGEEHMFKTLEEANKKVEELSKQLNDLAATQKILSEKGLDAAQAVKKIEELTSKVEQVEADKKLAEKKAEFQKLLVEKKVCPAQEKAFLDGDLAEFARLASGVKLNEAPAGSSKDPDPEISDDMGKQRAKIDELVQKKLNAITFNSPRERLAYYSKALQEVRKENPQLFKSI